MNVANASLSQRSSHHFMVTRLPNHMWAISWLMTSATRWSSWGVAVSGSTSSSTSLKVTQPRFSMAPAAKSGRATRSTTGSCAQEPGPATKPVPRGRNAFPGHRPSRARKIGPALARNGKVDRRPNPHLPTERDRHHARTAAPKPDRGPSGPPSRLPVTPLPRRRRRECRRG